jgi:hypothetical protein
LARNTLLVDGPADLLYLEVISGFLRDAGHEFLDPRWVLVPGGGLDDLPAMAALLGAPLDLAVLLDLGSGHRRVRSLVQRGVLIPERLVSLAELVGEAEAGLEDLLGDAFYLRLLASAGIGKPAIEEVRGSGRLLTRVERALGQPVDRYRAARTLLLRQAELLPGLPGEVGDRFTALFTAVNRLLD